MSSAVGDIEMQVLHGGEKRFALRTSPYREVEGHSFTVYEASQVLFSLMASCFSEVSCITVAILHGGLLETEDVIFHFDIARRLLYVQKFDIEYQSAACGYRTDCLVAVCKLRWYEEAVFASYTHELKAFRPTRNDLIQWKGDRFASLYGGIENLSVQKCTMIVYVNGIGSLRLLSLCSLEDLVL